ncbi:MAG: hypothetical protein ACREQT_05400 [Candidatus Binataceae bacterium]
MKKGSPALCGCEEMSLRHKWQHIRHRNWEEIRDSWLANTPTFSRLGEPPDPGLERLPNLLELEAPTNVGRFADVEGLRTNALREAVFLFEKCSHTALAAQRLGQGGMHSWCSFNVYHSAYIGARGIMTLLGVSLASLRSGQMAIDLFPEPETPKKKKNVHFVPQFNEFVIIRIPMLDQRYLWEGFQRVLRMTDAKCWDLEVRKELLNVAWDEITPPRNHFLYRAAFWPLDDLMKDVPPEKPLVCSASLDPEANGFLIRLGFSVYRLFEQLMIDLASYSGVIKTQTDASRFLDDGKNVELVHYRGFVGKILSSDIASGN